LDREAQAILAYEYQFQLPYNRSYPLFLFERLNNQGVQTKKTENKTRLFSAFGQIPF
jgi:hypothetical protein